MRVKVSETGLYTYPDLVIVCDVPQFLDGGDNTLLNPTLLIEVLSPSTEVYDRGRKFELYQAIPSLKQYLLIASERVHADLFTRQPNNKWLLQPAGTIELESVGCRISLRDTYERVEFS
jgi:Uma2 family endonuclease